MGGGARIRVGLLGDCRVTLGDAVLPVPGARLRALLVRLALAGGRAVEPSALVDAIWAEEPPSAPGPALQTLISRLRRALAPAEPADGMVVQVPAGYRLAVTPADVDALRFEQLAIAGRESLRAGDSAGAVAVLTEALTVWGDHPGAAPAVIAPVAPAVATRLAQMSVEAVADLAEAESSLGRVEAATARLTELLAERPVHERAAALLMDALAAQGRQADALAVYERVRATLADDLGADPGTALRDRHLHLLRTDRPATAPDSSARAQTAGGSGRVRAARLPAPLTSFVGRDDDLARIGTLLANGRLVTVVGPGGAGKTRLALEAVRRNGHEYRDGAWLVDLAPVTEPQKIATAILGGIGLRGGAMLDPRRRVDDDELEVLAGELGGRECLLLVDNCEHLIDAVAHVLSALLSRCAGLRVLATSREPLAVDGEALVPLGPLPLPGPADDAASARATASVRLFAERAAAVRPGFAVDEKTLPEVLRVVRGLDGLPLALELAAARLRTMSLPDLAEGLADRFRLLTTGSRSAPARHRTLRGVIAWSWDLLDEDERTVADRISILPGGVTTASAAAVCAGTTVPAAEIPELLATLVDRSLVQLAPSPARYRMLETLREYGIERLTGAGQLDTARGLAAAHVTRLVSDQDRRLRGPHQLTAMATIGVEYDNALAALRHWCTTGDSTGATALTLALTWYWQMSGRHSDAAHWLAETLAVPGPPTPERDCVRAAYLLNRADILSGITTGEAADDRAEMRDLSDRLLTHPDLPSHYRVIGPVLLFLRGHESALPAFEGLAGGDDTWLSGLAHMFLAEIAANEGAPDRADRHVTSALARFRQAGDRWGQAATLPMRAQLRRYDDLDGALADLTEARTLAGEFGTLSLGDQLYSDLRWIDLHLRRGDDRQALALIGSARERALHASSAELLVMIDTREADLRIRRGDLGRAAELLDDADRGLLGDTAFLADHARAEANDTRAALALALGDLPAAEEALRRAYAAAVETRELPALSQVTATAAAVAEARGQHRDAARRLGAAARLRGAEDHTDPRLRALTERLRSTLGESEFVAAYDDGRAGVASADRRKL